MNELLGRLALPFAAAVLLAGCSGAPSRAPIRDLQSALSAPPAGAAVDPRLQRHLESWSATPYAFGGTGAAGIDCSGFVQMTYARLYRVDLPRTTWAQRRAGREVRAQQLGAGDLVFFSVDGRDSHVGIYMGDGDFMHASTSRGVVRDRLFAPYWANRFSAAVRVLDES